MIEKESLQTETGSTDGFESKADIARRLRKTTKTVDRWASLGFIPFLKIGSGRRATVMFHWPSVRTALIQRWGVGKNLS